MLRPIDLETEWIIRKKVFQLKKNFPKKDIDRSLRINLAGISLENPLILGAGFDKTGLLVKSLYNLGFAAVEIGSIAQRPQPGNKKPRFFHLGHGVFLNRFGFNSPGIASVAENLKKYSGIPTGINIGINKSFTVETAAESIAASIPILSPLATYFVINVSSPNTPGLRKLQQKKHLLKILTLAKLSIKKQEKILPFL